MLVSICCTPHIHAAHICPSYLSWSSLSPHTSPGPLCLSPSPFPLSFILPPPSSLLQFTGITKELPYNVHLLTVQSLTKGHVLIRLENQYQADEPPWNQPASVTLDVSVFFVYLHLRFSVVSAQSHAHFLT